MSDEAREREAFADWWKEYRTRRHGLSENWGAKDAWQAALAWRDCEWKDAANLLIDYCEAHGWGTIPEPYDSINPLLKLLGRDTERKR